MRPCPGVPGGGSIQSAPSDSQANWVEERLGMPFFVTAKSRFGGVARSTRSASPRRGACARERDEPATTSAAATPQARAPLRAAEDRSVVFGIRFSKRVIRNRESSLREAETDSGGRN